MATYAFRVTAFDPRSKRREVYGWATDQTGADSLLASCKVQNVPYRGAVIETLKGERQFDLFGG